MRENLHVAMSAREYHEYISSATGPWDDLIIRRVTDVYRPLQSGRIIVDIGTGTAVLPIRLARLPVFKDATFIATDFFNDMIDIARAAVREAGLEQRIRTEQCDVHALPYPDNFADYAISRSTIHHWADPVQAFREIYRILRPGGIALIHDPRRDPNPEVLQEFNRRRRDAGFEPNDLNEKYTPGEVAAFLKSAGIAAQSEIAAPDEGPASMGFEVCIRKPDSD
jgi:SAM-dependent methyltransferase